MLKVISLLKRKEDLSFEAFRKWAFEEHPQLGKQLPGLRHYRMSVLVAENSETPYDAVSEFWFDDDEARLAAFDTPEGAAAAADAAAHCAARFHLLTEEKILVE